MFSRVLITINKTKYTNTKIYIAMNRALYFHSLFSCSEDVTLKQPTFATIYQKGNRVYKAFGCYIKGLKFSLITDLKENKSGTWIYIYINIHIFRYKYMHEHNKERSVDTITVFNQWGRGTVWKIKHN